MGEWSPGAGRGFRASIIPVKLGTVSTSASPAGLRVPAGREEITAGMCLRDGELQEQGLELVSSPGGEALCGCPDGAVGLAVPVPALGAHGDLGSV